MKVKILDTYSYQTFPIVEGMIEVNDEYLKLIGNGKKFDLSTNTIVEDTEYEIRIKEEEERIKKEEESQQIINRINKLKSLLSQTDYKAIKYAEGLISEEEYAPIKAQRQLWRDEINRIEQGE